MIKKQLINYIVHIYFIYNVFQLGLVYVVLFCKIIFIRNLYLIGKWFMSNMSSESNGGLNKDKFTKTKDNTFVCLCAILNIYDNLSCFRSSQIKNLKKKTIHITPGESFFLSLYSISIIVYEREIFLCMFIPVVFCFLANFNIFSFLFLFLVH